MKPNLVAKFLASAVLLLLIAAIAGCATVDWKSRVGNYTYDQALAELGKPDSVFKLDDGKTVARWVTVYSSGFTPRSGYVHENIEMGVGQNTGPNMAKSVLQLTFGPDGKLLSSVKVN